jgi:hypothetical protein
LRSRAQDHHALYAVWALAFGELNGKSADEVMHHSAHNAPDGQNRSNLTNRFGLHRRAGNRNIDDQASLHLAVCMNQL